MSTQDSLLAQGIAAATAGDRSTARRLLTEAVQRDPASTSAWLWLSSVLDTPQGRAFCLQQVLALDPANRAAKRGLLALEKAQRAPAIVAREPEAAITPASETATLPVTEAATAPVSEAASVPVSETAAAPATRGRLLLLVERLLSSARRWPALVGRLRRRIAGPSSLRSLVKQPQFLQGLVLSLAFIALALIAALVYTTIKSAVVKAGDPLAAAATATRVPGPRGTLRPTFTSTPTHTPTPTDTPTPTPTYTFTPTPTPTETPSPTPTRRPRRVIPSPTPTPSPRPTMPPRMLDPRLADLGVRVEPAFVADGQPYWRLVEARWTDERESAGKHSIFVDVLDLNGNLAVGQPVIVQWSEGNVILLVEDRPPPDWPVNFGMYNTLGSYGVSVGGLPSDRIVGLGLGSLEAPSFTIHTSFYLVFRFVYRW